MKTFAVIIVAICSVCVYGREMMLSAFAENRSDHKEKLVNSITNKSTAVEKIESKVLGRVIKNLDPGTDGELPFLCKYVKYRCRFENDCICYYNSNQELYYSPELGICLRFIYDCRTEAGDMAEEACIESAIKGIHTVFSRFGTFKILSYECMFFDDREMTFSVITNITGDIPITVSVRRDTGSVIFFDASDAREYLSEHYAVSFDFMI